LPGVRASVTSYKPRLREPDGVLLCLLCLLEVVGEKRHSSSSSNSDSKNTDHCTI